MFELITFITTGILTTLTAGTFFGYAISVNGALHKLKDDEYVRAMQAINVVIQNSVFLFCFMGPILLLPLSTILALDNPTQFWLLLIAAALYIVGVFGVTAFGNVPLNDRLAKADPSDATRARNEFERPWNRLHFVRTVAGIVVTTLIFTAYII